MNYYAAYGSNLNMDQMKRRCPDAEVIDTSWLPGYELVFRRGFLTVEKNEKTAVPIGIWKISESDERSLDRYEGYPKFYTKQFIPIEFSDGWVRNCLIYIMVDGHPILAPSDGYFTTVYHGYRQFGIDDKKMLMEAYEKAKWG